MHRQPFPGPGLATRILCATKPYLEKFEEISNQLQQFATFNPRLLPVRTVGVQGDKRTYTHLAALSGGPDWPELVQAAREIPRVVQGVNRVVYVFGEPLLGDQKSISETYVNEDTLFQLRTADNIVRSALKKSGLDKSISQVPVILFPVDFGMHGCRSIGIRTMITTDYKVGDIAVPGREFPTDVLDDIVHDLLENVVGISRVVYDLTSKPPATTEWE